MTRRTTWVQAHLCAWGQWVTQRCIGGLGYPTVNILAKNGGQSASSADYVPTNSLLCEQVDRAVRVVAGQDLGLWLVLMCRYAGDPDVRPARRRPMSCKELEQRLGVSKQMVGERLRRAERQVDEVLSIAGNAGFD